MPVTVDLKAAGVLGVAGADGSARALGSLVGGPAGRLAHAPDARALPPGVAGEAAADWDWVRWLPHARSRSARARRRYGSATTRPPASNASRSSWPCSKPARRRAENASWTPAVVVVLDGVRALRAQPGVPRLLRDGPARGIYAIGLDHDPSRLAEEGRAEVAFEPDGLTATVRVDGQRPGRERAGAIRSAPALGRAGGPPAGPRAGCRRRGGRGGDPVLGSLRRPGRRRSREPGGVVDRWRAGGRTTRAPVGVSIDGTFFLDLERDGPHALVAGTTGSGKSEFLQTLVASLALANRPDAIHFVLVDYKGASAFADCAELPHTVGLVTNLDGRETQRALASLDAELRRREACLHQLRAADVNSGLGARSRSRPAAMGLARLVLVIDEFAELVHELPDFVTGLIRIARVGRSLGVHLILATQRPAGVVTGEMRANTGLRVALRMEDSGDSLEVLESSDGGRDLARHSGPGLRPHRRRRPDRRLPGGSGGGTEKGGECRSAPSAGLARARGRGWATRSAFRVGNGRTDRAGPPTSTPWSTLMAKAAEEAGIPPGRSPWLEPLPGVVGLDQLPPRTRIRSRAGRPCLRPRGPPGRAVAAGCPSSTWSDGAHLAVAGAARSGRSTLLRTLAGQPGPVDLAGRRAPLRSGLRQRRVAPAGVVAALRRGRDARRRRAHRAAGRAASSTRWLAARR